MKSRIEYPTFQTNDEYFKYLTDMLKRADETIKDARQLVSKLKSGEIKIEK